MRHGALVGVLVALPQEQRRRLWPGFFILPEGVNR